MSFVTCSGKQIGRGTGTGNGEKHCGLRSADCGVKGEKPKTGVGPEHFGPPVAEVYPPVLVAGWVMACGRPVKEARRHVTGNGFFHWIFGSSKVTLGSVA